jgi:hypothetical protein
MPRAPCIFRQRDLTRAIKGARAAGIDVACIEVDKDGRIIILPTQSAAVPETARNEWDEVPGG